MPGPVAPAVIDAERAAQQAGDDRARHADEHRDEDAARIFAGHDGLGDGADDETDNQ